MNKSVKNSDFLWIIVLTNKISIWSDFSFWPVNFYPVLFIKEEIENQMAISMRFPLSFTWTFDI